MRNKKTLEQILGLNKHTVGPFQAFVVALDRGFGVQEDLGQFGPAAGAADGEPCTFCTMHDPVTRRAYWRANLRYVLVPLAIWFAVSYGCGILFVDQLDRIRIGGFKLGFWFAQ